MIRKIISCALLDRYSDTVRLGIVRLVTGIIFLTAFAFTLSLLFMIMGVAGLYIPMNTDMGNFLERFLF